MEGPLLLCVENETYESKCSPKFSKYCVCGGRGGRCVCVTYEVSLRVIYQNRACYQYRHSLYTDACKKQNNMGLFPFQHAFTFLFCFSVLAWFAGESMQQDLWPSSISFHNGGPVRTTSDLCMGPGLNQINKVSEIWVLCLLVLLYRTILFQFYFVIFFHFYCGLRLFQATQYKENLIRYFEILLSRVLNTFVCLNQSSVCYFSQSLDWET